MGVRIRCCSSLRLVGVNWRSDVILLGLHTCMHTHIHVYIWFNRSYILDTFRLCSKKYLSLWICCRTYSQDCGLEACDFLLRCITWVPEELLLQCTHQFENRYHWLDSLCWGLEWGEKAVGRLSAGRHGFLCVTLQGAERYKLDTGTEQSRWVIQTHLLAGFCLFKCSKKVLLSPGPCLCKAMI